MKRTEKEGFVEEFRERLQESPAIFLTDFTGLDVKSMTVLRDELKKNGAEYLVVKNRLVLRALEGIGDSGPLRLADGTHGCGSRPFGSGGSRQDRFRFRKEPRRPPSLQGGRSGQRSSGRRPDSAARQAAVQRSQLLAMLAGALEAPMAALAGAMEGKLQEMVGLMKALQEEREGGEA